LLCLLSKGSTTSPSGSLLRGDLVAAAGAGTLTQSRLSGGFRPPGERPRSGGAAKNYKLMSVAARALDAARADESLGMSDLGAAHLLVGNIDEAVLALQYRRSDAPADAAAGTDLSAAFLERAARDGEPQDHALAYDAACRSLEMAPGRPEALFNRAAALEGLGLRGPAAQAWNEFLHSERDADWRRVGARRLEEVVRRDRARQVQDRAREALRASLPAAPLAFVVSSASAWPDMVHDVAARRILPAVARWLNGERDPLALPPETAEKALREMEGASKASFEFEARALRALGRRPLELGRAHIGYAAALELIAARRYAEAETRLGAIEAAFQDGDSPYAGWVQYRLAVLDYRRGRLEQGNRRVSEILKRQSPDQVELVARALWVRALLVPPGPGAVLDTWKALSDAEKAFEQIGDRQAIADLAARQAGVLTELGDLRAAWRYRFRSLAGISAASSAALRYANLTFTIADMETTGLHAGARDLARLSVATADAAGAMESFDVRKELIREAADELPLDPTLVRDATAALGRLPDEGLRAALAAELSLVEASARARRGEAPVALAEAAVRSFAEQRKGYLHSSALLALGRSLRRAGRIEDALDATSRAFEELRAGQMDTASGEVSVAAQEAMGEAAEDLVGALVDGGREAEALSTVRALEGRPSHGPLTDDRVVLVFFAREESTEAWVCARDFQRHATLDLSGPRRRSIAARYRLASELGQPERARRILEGELYPRLIAPIETWLFRGVGSLVVVPPGDLHAVPLGLLRPGAPSRRLFERGSLWFGSSVARAFDAPLTIARSGGSLIVGGADFGGEDATLIPLPESRAEAEEVASLYRDAILLTGPRATRDLVAAAVRGKGMVHLATHGVANDARPGLSYVALGAGAAGSGRWYAADPTWRLLKGVGLVVLSSCFGAGGDGARSGAALGLARALADAGVGQIVASTARTNDHTTRVLMRRFHALIVKGMAAGDALRQAQEEAIRELGPEVEADVISFRVYV
jgi:CHAT domain-containing protein/tetratricopeptide (TPR) repeat protein